MFRVKAKTNSVKIKDINKYIGRVWININENEALRSKDLLSNKHKLIVQTDNAKLKALFNSKSVVTKTKIPTITIVQEKNIFVAQPDEKPIDTVDVIAIAEPETKVVNNIQEDVVVTFDAEKASNELIDTINEAQQISNTIDEQIKPEQIEQVQEPIVFDEVKEDIIVDKKNIEVEQLEEPFKVDVQDTQIKNEKSFIYNVNSDDTPKKRRGRPKKSPQ